MDENNLEEEVIKFVGEQLGVESKKITLDSRFVEDLGADSLDLVEVMMNLEDEYEIKISDDEADKLKTIRGVVNYIRNPPKYE